MEKLFNQLIIQMAKVENKVPANNEQKTLIENLLKEIEQLVWELTESEVTLRLSEPLNKEGARKLLLFLRKVKENLEKLEELPAYKVIEDKEVIKAFTNAYFYSTSKKHQEEKK